MGAFCPFLARRPATAFQPRIAPEPPAASSHYKKTRITEFHKLYMLTLDTNDSKKDPIFNKEHRIFQNYYLSEAISFCTACAWNCAVACLVTLACSADDMVGFFVMAAVTCLVTKALASAFSLAW